MSRVHAVPILLALTALAFACEDRRQKPTTTTSASQPAGPGALAPTSEVPPPPAAGGARTPAARAVEPVLTWKDVGLAVPESVIHDVDADVYLVSNVNGRPLEADGNGFISRLTVDGKVEKLKWIEGGKNKVTLNAPKGMGFLGDHLYVNDIDTVRMFDRTSGAPAGEIRVPGASFLNDLAVTTDGHVLVSDSGMKSGAKGFSPVGTDAVYSIDKSRKLVTLAKGKELANPNGLLAALDRTWVTSMSSNELYALDAKGKKADSRRLPKGSLDGIVMLPGGDLLVASWDAGAVYRGDARGGDFVPAVENVKSPADIGYDIKRRRLLVPLFESDELQAYEVK